MMTVSRSQEGWELFYLHNSKSKKHDGKDDYFQSRAFEKVLIYVGSHGRACTLRDGERKSLLIKNISTMEGALSVLEVMENKGIQAQP